VDTVTLRRLDALFFIDLERRKVFLAGVTGHPVGPWATQQARDLAATLEDQGRAIRFPVRDRCRAGRPSRRAAPRVPARRLISRSIQLPPSRSVSSRLPPFDASGTSVLHGLQRRQTSWPSIFALPDSQIATVHPSGLRCWRDDLRGTGYARFG
jgi:hypothetical protein